MVSKIWTEWYGLLIFLGMACLLLVSLGIGIGWEYYHLYTLPIGVLVLFFTFYDFKQVYLLLLFCLPLTTEVYLSSAYALHVPAELLTILLLGIFFFFVLTKNKYPTHFIRHPIAQILILHVLWIGVSVIFAYKQFIALKFFIAKLWFVIPFFFLTHYFIKDLRDFKRAFWVVFIPLMGTIFIALFKQWQTGFDFDEVNRTVQPFYHNHVNYAALLSLFLPFVWIVTNWYKKYTLPYYTLWLSRILIIVAIIYSYTRGAWLALICGLIFLLALNKRFVSWLIAGVIALFLIVGVHLVHNNKYIDYAPEYKEAIYHANISAHLEATINIEDVSTAERFFRWVGGVRMSTANPITGFGPNNFYHHYKHYTVTAFTTYVSENPQKSGVHNYFLMTVIEQGFVGLFLFLALVLSYFYYGTQLYRKIQEKRKKQLVGALLVSMVIILVQIFLSDLIEAMKIGSFFFINLAMLVNLDLSERDRLTVKNNAEST